MVFFKRTSLVATLALLSLTITSANAAEPTLPFKDIKGSFAVDSITTLYEKGLISGVSEDEFAPQLPVKRKHFVLLLAKTVGIQPIDPTEPTFHDIPRESIEFGYIEAFAKLGYIQGSGDKRFNGDSFIQRQDAAVILDHVFSQTFTNQPQSKDIIYYKDQDMIRPYARESVQRISSMSLMNGYNQVFSPQKNVSRAEIAVIAQKVHDLIHQDQETRSLEGMKLKVGDSQKIPLPFTNTVFSYSPVWGWDNPAIGNIKADGQFTAKAPGKGLISLNLGNKVYQIPIEIIEKENNLEENPS